MKVVCYGDSNTYGFDPRSFFGGRYDSENRWVDLFAEKTGWTICNEGLNGREIPRGAVTVPVDTDLLIVMLGTNDLLQGCTAEACAERMERFLNALDVEKRKLLLIAPPPMGLGEWVPNRSLIAESIRLGEYYEEIAQRMGIQFVNTEGWDIPMAYDGVHFTEEGHRRFADALIREIKCEVRADD